MFVWCLVWCRRLSINLDPSTPIVFMVLPRLLMRIVSDTSCCFEFQCTIDYHAGLSPRILLQNSITFSLKIYFCLPINVIHKWTKRFCSEYERGACKVVVWESNDICAYSAYSINNMYSSFIFSKGFYTCTYIYTIFYFTILCTV